MNDTITYINTIICINKVLLSFSGEYVCIITRVHERSLGVQIADRADIYQFMPMATFPLLAWRRVLSGGGGAIGPKDSGNSTEQRLVNPSLPLRNSTSISGVQSRTSQHIFTLNLVQTPFQMYHLLAFTVFPSTEAYKFSR